MFGAAKRRAIRDGDGIGARGRVRGALMGRGVAISIGVIAVVTAGLYLIARPASEPSLRRNVVLIVLDTVRADRLGSLGSTRGLTPALDAFAKEAAVFERAYSHAPWTLPSIASLFSGRDPLSHGAGGRLGTFQRMPDGVETIAERFRAARFRTGAIVNALFVTETFGMTQGFEHVDAVVPRANESARRADATTDAALNWIDHHRDEPFFLFVHYFDAHLLYDPPPEFRTRFADPQDRRPGPILFGRLEDMLDFRGGKVRLDEPIVRRLEKLYDGEVAYLDSQVGRLFDGLAQRGLSSYTVVAVTSDHGEEFFDHGGFEHGHTLYEELLHVPLMIRAPGRTTSGTLLTPRRVSAVVRLMDVAPTLCELAGVPAPKEIQGDSLLPLMTGRDDLNRPVYAFGNLWGESGEALRKEDWKVIREAKASRVRLFDLRHDPREQRDLSGTEAARRDRMVAELDLIRRASEAARQASTQPSLTREQREHLQSLGYLKSEDEDRHD